ncbi:MAG: magnesium transporter, partial [Actinomycetota bacterium]
IAIAATARSYVARDPALRRVVVEMTGTILLTPILDVVAGGLLLAREPQLVAVPVLLALVPPFVSQAGALGGIFASRTTSKLQIGVLTPRGLPEVPAIVDAVVVSLLAVAVFALIGVLAVAVGLATGLPGIPPFGTLVGGTLLAGILLVPVMLVLAYELAVLTFRFGLDPDNQGVPIITSVMDVAGVVAVLSVMTSLGVLPHG